MTEFESITIATLMRDTIDILHDVDDATYALRLFARLLSHKLRENDVRFNRVEFLKLCNVDPFGCD